MEILADTKRETVSNVSAGKNEPSEVRRRMLQIRGVKGMTSPKERFNEDTKEETMSIRQQLPNQGKLTLTEDKIRKEGGSIAGS